MTWAYFSIWYENIVFINSTLASNCELFTENQLFFINIDESCVIGEQGIKLTIEISILEEE